jgi:hypothetical protein
MTSLILATFRKLITLTTSTPVLINRSKVLSHIVTLIHHNPLHSLHKMITLNKEMRMVRLKIHSPNNNINLIKMMKERMKTNMMIT